MGISVREQAIFAAVEQTPGTAETLAGGDAIQVMNLTVNPVSDIRMIEREIIRSSLNPEKAVYGGALYELQFDVEMKGSGTAGTAPRLGVLLRACGCEETVVASTSVTYNPISDLASHETVTIGYKEGANYRIVKGCMGTFSINSTAGEYARITFTMKGKIESETEASAPSASFETTVPPAFLGATFQVGGFAAPIETLTMDVQNQVTPGINPNNSDGFSDFVRITARNTVGTINPEVEAINTKDYVGILRAGTNQAIQTGAIGGSGGNQWSLSCAQAYFRNVGSADRDELLTYDIEFGAADTDGTDDFALQFT
jgi:hypothetical protein